VLIGVALGFWARVARRARSLHLAVASDTADPATRAWLRPQVTPHADQEGNERGCGSADEVPKARSAHVAPCDGSGAKSASISVVL